MKCPFCKSELIPGENKLFETLIEHCSPSQEFEEFRPPERPTFICTCSIAENCFWDEWGGFYTGKLSKGHSMLIAKIKNHDPIGSLEEKITKQIKEKYNEQY